MRMLYLGPLWRGSTAEQRFRAMASQPGLTIHPVDTLEKWNFKPSLLDRILHRLHRPPDRTGIHDRLLTAAGSFQPTVIFNDSCRRIRPAFWRQLRSLYGCRLVYYTPDDLFEPHNRSLYLERSFQDFDLLFTTKSFNMEELKARGVRRPILIGKSFDPEIHRPMTPDEVGPEYEDWDVVLIGVWEAERMQSVNALAAAGFSVIVFGENWPRRKLHPAITLRPAVFHGEYAKALHFGKIALCPLRKMNRDQVTQRSIEIPACRRPMIAQKTMEHDTLFHDGQEYISYRDDIELADRTKKLLQLPSDRLQLASNGYRRCIANGCRSIDRAKEIWTLLQSESC